MMRDTIFKLAVPACLMISLLLGSALADEEVNVPTRIMKSPTVGFSEETLAGRKVVVRIYNDWRVDPRAYELVKVPLTGLSISFDSIRKASDGVDESTALVITGPDQNDDVAADVIGEVVYAECYGKGKQLALRPTGIGEKKPERRTIIDALGAPIRKASVDIFVRGISSEDPRVYLRTVEADKQGQFEIPHIIGSLRHFSFVVSNPNYGVFVVDRYLPAQMKLAAPLVPQGTVAYERAIRGIVVDPEGQPVGGAVIQCSHVRTLGEGLINAQNGWTYTSLTDDQGAFSLYLPNENRRGERGYLIPPKSQYQVRIDAPAEFGLLPHVKPIENGLDAVIVLERGGRCRTFVFEDANGPIVDFRRLQFINVTIKQSKGTRVPLRYDDFKDGGVFPSGTYEATAYEHGSEVEYQPLVVDEDSPDVLVFKIKEEILYYGQIVHGLTGEPLPGAFVFGFSGKRKGNLSMITDRQWEALHALPVDPCLTDPAVKPICEIYSVKKIVRTDEQGYFQMSFRPGEIYGFIAFEENYLGLMHRRHALIPDEHGMAKIPAMTLYPAATVFVEACTDARHISIWPRWIIDENENAVWVGDFLATDDRRESMFTYDSWLEQNQVQSFHVPAGLNVRVKLDTPYDKKWCPIEFPKMIHLAQGQAIDLGWHEFKPALKVSVRVTDAQGEPLEGVPVRRVWDGNHWGVPHNSDVSGISRFYVVPNSQGEFGVSYHDEGGVHLRETIPYAIGGKEDEDRQFTLQLSDEMLGHLFK